MRTLIFSLQSNDTVSPYLLFIFFSRVHRTKEEKNYKKELHKMKKKKDFMKSISKFPSKYKIQFLFLNIIFDSSISKLYIYIKI